MKPLSHTNEKWLFDQSKEAWGYYICFKYAKERSKVKGIMPDEIKSLIKDAYKRDM